MTYPTGIPEHVTDLFETLAFQVHSRGFRKYSARALLHQIRWHHRIERGDVHFKVNNNYSRVLARWFHQKHPKMDGFFETRERSPHNNSFFTGYDDA